jgi:hypothetical protein
MFDKCKRLEEELLLNLKDSKILNLNNFDSGLEAEKILTNTLRKLFPTRYSIYKGILSDRHGCTSGEHDIILFNETWFPLLTGNDENAHKKYFPIEGVYAIGEVKQTLTVDSLDEGIEKLVKAQRLYRPQVGVNRYTENRKKGDRDLGTANPLFTFLVAFNQDSQFQTEEIFSRFFEINKRLYRQEMVRCLCVINKFSIIWSTQIESERGYNIARFTSKDEEEPVFPVLQLGTAKNESSLYNLIFYLGAHLNECILGSEDIYVAYGNNNSAWKFPEGQEWIIENF